MRIVKMNKVGGFKENLTAFGGINRTNECGDNEFRLAENLGSQHYPFLAPRNKRSSSTEIGGSQDGLKTSFVHYDYQTANGTATAIMYAYDSGTNTVYHTTQEGVSDFTLAKSTYPKTFVKMGARVVIHPDMIVFDSVAKTWERIAVSVDYSSAALFASTKDGEVVSAYTSNTPPSPASDGDYLYELSTGKLYQYSATVQEWVETQGYMILSVPDTKDVWREGDTIHFEAIAGVVLNGDPQIIKKWSSGGTIYHLFKGYFTTNVTSSGMSLTDEAVSRRVPTMDYICSAGNRLWGCRFGDGLNEIYASALGNPFAWYLFESTSMDSYVASIGDDGAFTGAIEYQGYPTFFKENMIYKVYGMYPAQYQINRTNAIGVKKGCGLCVWNNVLYYGSVDGLCAYTGSYPKAISERIHTAGIPIVATHIGGEDRWLYVSDNATSIFTYDTEKGLWHEEQTTNGVLHMECYKGKLYVGTGWYGIPANAYGVWSPNGSAEQDFDWSAETKKLPLWSKGKGYNPDDAYLAEIQMRVESFGGEFTLYVGYDNKDFEEVYHFDPSLDWRSLLSYSWDGVKAEYQTWSNLMAGNKSGVIAITAHIRLKRFTTARLRIEGNGDVRVCSLTKHWRLGSDSTWK